MQGKQGQNYFSLIAFMQEMQQCYYSSQRVCVGVCVY